MKESYEITIDNHIEYLWLFKETGADDLAIVGEALLYNSKKKSREDCINQAMLALTDFPLLFEFYYEYKIGKKFDINNYVSNEKEK